MTPALAALLFVAAPPGNAAVLPPCTFVGRVVTPAGEPAAGAGVSLRHGSGRAEDVFSTTAGADGRFTLAGLPADVVTGRHLLNHATGGLVAVPTGWGEGGGGTGLAPGLLPVPAPLPGRAVDVGDLPLSPGTVYRGRVLGPAGEPPEGEVRVECFARSGSVTVGALLPGRTVPLAADGAFFTPPLPPCVVDLTVRAAGYRSAAVLPRPDGTAAEVTLAPIRPEPELPAALRVVDGAGTPVAGATVRPYPFYEPAETDADGLVRLPGLGPDGPRQTLAAAPGLRDFNGRPAEEVGEEALPRPDGARVWRVVLERSRSLSFRVTDAATGDPVPVDSVVLCTYERGPDGTARLTGCGRPALEPGPPGVVSVQHRGPGAYHLEIKAAGYETGDIFLDPFAADEDRAVGPFALARRNAPAGAAGPADADAAAGPPVMGRMTGRVESAGGADPAGALVTLWLPGAETEGVTNASLWFGRLVPAPPRWVATTVADAGGRFSLPAGRGGETYLLRADAAPAGLPAGAVVPAAARPAPAVAEVAGVPGETIEVTLVPPPAGEIAGTLADEFGVIRGPAWAVAFDGAGLVRAAPVTPDGAFRFGGLPPGEYGVKAGQLGAVDRETFNGFSSGWPDAADTPADPWRRAVRVTVEPGATATVEVPVTD